MKVLSFIRAPRNITITLDETRNNAGLELHIPHTAAELGLPPETSYDDIETVRIVMFAQLKFYFQDYIGHNVTQVLAESQSRIHGYIEKLMRDGTMMIP
jgi:hypothetical protein